MVGLGMTGPSLETTNALESPPLNPPRAHQLGRQQLQARRGRRKIFRGNNSTQGEAVVGTRCIERWPSCWSFFLPVCVS